MVSAPPRIFSDARKAATRKRALRMQREEDAARFVLDDMVEEVLDRLAFVRHEPGRALVIGDWSGQLAKHLSGNGAEAHEADIVARGDVAEIDLEQPYPQSGFDLIACLGLLDTVNDLPGALIHIRNSLAPGGMAIASFAGAGSLPLLRNVMLAADGERPAGRMHPLVDVRAGAQLLQRAGWADPVADSHTIRASYASLDRLVGDVRAQGLGNMLASAPPPLDKAALARAEAAFAGECGEDERAVESFEILTLTGRRSLAGT